MAAPQSGSELHENAVKGRVLGFDPDTNTGVISGDDGVRYDFSANDWHGRSRPRHSDIVEFDVDGLRAHAISPIEPAYVAPGISRFYFSPAGRISRSQYWLRFGLPYFVIFFVLELFVYLSDKESDAYVIVNIIFTIFFLVTLWPAIVTLVKRIHDREKSGWRVLILGIATTVFIALVFIWVGVAFYDVEQGQSPNFDGPAAVFAILAIVSGVILLGINIWFFIEFGCLRGTIGPNRYGADPAR